MIPAQKRLSSVGRASGLVRASLCVALMAACNGDKGDKREGGNGDGGNGDGGYNQPSSWSVGGTLSGLAGGSLTIRNNFSDPLVLSANGPFVFPTKLGLDAFYDVKVTVQPQSPAQECTVTNGKGTVEGADVTSIAIACVTGNTVGGTVSGLEGLHLALHLSASPGTLTVLANGPFTFAETVLPGHGYEVSVSQQPDTPRQGCLVTNGHGIMGPSPVTDVSVACATYYDVGGSVSGLLVGFGSFNVVLAGPTGTLSTKSVGANGPFTFPDQVLAGTTYAASVVGSLNWQICDVSNATGTVSHAVTDIAVDCRDRTFTLGGTVRGLVGTGLVLQNNGGDDLTVNANGSFTFATDIARLETYDVTVATPPAAPSQYCVVQNGSGSLYRAEAITDVLLTCTVAQPVYPKHGAGWNDYVANDGGSPHGASDLACVTHVPAPAAYDACLHGGELRKFVSGAASCAGLSAADALGAFDWICDNQTGKAIFYSTGLKRNVRLSDLVDFEEGSWTLNNLIVTGGSGNLALGGMSSNVSPLERWWPNPVVLYTPSATLNTSGAIYLVTTDPAKAIELQANGAGLVIQPGVTLTGPAPSNKALVYSGAGQVWIEGAVDATSESRGVYLRESRFSVLRGLAVSGGTTAGVYVYLGSGNRLTDITVTNSASWGLYLQSSDRNTVESLTASVVGSRGLDIVGGAGNRVVGVAVSGAPSEGIRISGGATSTWIEDARVAGSSGNGITIGDSSRTTLLRALSAGNRGYGIRSGGFGDRLLDVVADGNSSAGIWLTGADGLIVGATVVANQGAGLSVQDASIASSPAMNPLILDVTAANNTGNGVFIVASDVTLRNLAAANNGAGLRLLNTSGAKVHNVACTNNGGYGINLNSSGVVFTGAVIVGGNPTANCYNSSSTGLDGTCANLGASSATLTTGASLASSFVGKVTAGDSVNASDTAGAAAFASITDWLGFENPYRSWGLDGSSDFPSAVYRGRCATGMQCRIWDWSLRAADSVILDARATQAAGNAANTASHAFAAGTQTFLRAAMELAGDGVGDEDGLCESNEACLVTTNLGSYQGHGPLGSGPTFANGDTLTGITLRQTLENGYE